jgi:signal transduction histidine kinase
MAKCENMEEPQKDASPESLGTMVGDIVHDLSGILTGIMWHLTMAKRAVEKESEVFEIISGAEKASLQARELTRQLLDLTRGATQSKKPDPDD